MWWQWCVLSSSILIHIAEVFLSKSNIFMLKDRFFSDWRNKSQCLKVYCKIDIFLYQIYLMYFSWFPWPHLSSRPWDAYCTSSATQLTNFLQVPSIPIHGTNQYLDPEPGYYSLAISLKARPTRDTSRALMHLATFVCRLNVTVQDIGSGFPTKS